MKQYHKAYPPEKQEVQRFLKETESDILPLDLVYSNILRAIELRQEKARRKKRKK